MSRRYTGLALGALLVAGAGWLLAQQTPPPHTKETAPASYTIHPSADTSLLLDGERGKAWLLNRRGDGQAAWLPIPRLDSDEEAARWRKAGPPADPPATGGGLPGAGDLLKRQGYVAVPLDRPASGYLAVGARINQKKVYLAVDTAAPTTHLDRDRTGRLQLKWREGGGKAPLPAGQAGTAVCLVEGLEVGPLRVARLAVGAHDLSHINQGLEQRLDPPIDGVLGADVLAGYGAVIDYPGSVMFLRARHAPE